ncbi:MAG: 30S ribosomal protein S1 [Desulfobacteraceae bacterium]|nr:MAG: 30S ribosomal protein S1 [Desulfobacteraceae bacterium]
MIDNQRNGQEEEVSFAELLKEAESQVARPEPGQKVTVTIAGIGDEFVFLDLGAKSEGYLARQELLDEQGNLTVKPGDRLEAYFLSENNGELLFTTSIGSGPAAHAHLEEAWRSGIPVEGQVEKEIKGGFEIKVAGGVRGFCPYSQMDLRRIAEPASLVGQRFDFRITQYSEKGRNIVLSRRVLLEEERKRKRQEIKESLREGTTIRGTIASIQSFGAFLDVGGVEGLIPISEMAWGRVEDVHEIVAVGQEVEVVVMKLDWEKDRLVFSLKSTQTDPWKGVADRYPEGSWHEGKVVRLANFGAFVTLEPGIDGLIHISELGSGRRINHPREVLEEGQAVRVRIAAVDAANKRLSLSLSEAKDTKEREEKQEYERALAKVRGRSPQKLGSLGDLLKAKLEKKK